MGSEMCIRDRDVVVEHRGPLDHRRAVDRRLGEGVRDVGWAAAGVAHGQRAGVHLGSAAGLLCWVGTPWNNGFIESFNNRLRDECLNRNYWPTLLEARVVIEDFKDDHNHRHRHSALGYKTPAEYAAGCTHRHQPVACEID